MRESAKYLKSVRYLFIESDLGATLAEEGFCPSYERARPPLLSQTVEEAPLEHSIESSLNVESEKPRAPFCFPGALDVTG